MLANLQPKIFFIEETKYRKQNQIKSENISNYFVYQLNRQEKMGGGIAIGVDKSLDPVWINEGNDDIELLNVQVDFDGFKVRCVCGYGPQENASLEKKTSFWTQLSLEVEGAQEAEVGLIIQMDGNLWAGDDLIKGDPNQMNNNGKHFKEFLKSHGYLTVVNSLSLCEGLITRSRITKIKTEKSVLDFFIVCDRVLPFVRRMVVDEEKQYALSSMHTKKGVSYKKDSDHNPLILWLEMSICSKKADRKEYFNFKIQNARLISKN